MNETFHVTPFQFTGRGRDYFRIWIVDLALTILTLGFYSAWATARRKTWFYGHTRLDGHNFDYLGDPAAILRGRLLYLALIAATAIAWLFQPELAAAFSLALLLALPLAALQAQRFNARNSGYRGIRFDFLGNTSAAYRTYLVWGLLSVASLGLLLPSLLHRRIAYLAGNHAYGNTRFGFECQCLSFYGIFMKASLIMMLPVVALFAGGITLASVVHGEPVGMTEILAALGLGLILLYAALPIAAGYVNERIGRLMFLGTRFADMGFAGRHTARGLIRLYVSNLIWIVLTLGLFIPWARVRSAHFWLDNLAVVGPENGLEKLAAASFMAPPPAESPGKPGAARPDGPLSTNLRPA